MKTFRKMSARQWIKRLEKALGDAYSDPDYRKRISSQHHSIRSWDLGPGKPASPTDGTGFRLLK